MQIYYLLQRERYNLVSKVLKLQILKEIDYVIFFYKRKNKIKTLLRKV